MGESSSCQESAAPLTLKMSLRNRHQRRCSTVNPDLITRVFVEPKILEKILKNLDTNSLLAARYVCRSWHSASKVPLQERLTLERTASVYLEGAPSSWPSNYCSAWFRLMLLEADEKPATDRELSVQEDTMIGLSIYSICPGLLSFLPESVWAERISVLCFDHSLTVQDWNEGGCLLVSGLRSLRRLDMRFGLLRGIWDDTMNFDNVIYSENPVIEEVHVKLDDSVFSEADKAFQDSAFGVFDMAFMGLCPKLQRLSLDLENHLMSPMYREMMTATCNRLASGKWNVELFSKLFDQEVDAVSATFSTNSLVLQTEVRAMFAYIPVEELSVKLISGVDPVMDIVSGTTSLRKLKIDCNRVRYGFNLVASLVNSWSRSSAFGSLLDLSLEFRDDEARIGSTVPFCADADELEPGASRGSSGIEKTKEGSLANVTKLEIIHQQVTHWDFEPPEASNEGFYGEQLATYWAEILRHTPNVRILVAAAAARCQFLQARNLTKLNHVVWRQTFADVVEVPNSLFTSELGVLVEQLTGLTSFTLDFEQDSEWDKSFNFCKTFIANRTKDVLVAFAGKSSVKLIQINSPFLVNLRLEPGRSNETDIEVRVFNSPHGQLYDCIRNEPIEAFDTNVEGHAFNMMSELSELEPAYIFHCNERNAAWF